MVKHISILCLSLILAACGGSSGGVISDPTPDTGSSPAPTSTPAATPTPGPSAFNESFSQLRFYKNNQVTNQSGVSDQVSVKLTARDSSNNLKSGLTVQIRVEIEGVFQNLSTTEESPGIYSATFAPGYQGPFLAQVNVNQVSTNLETILTASFCNNAADPASAPFHRTASLDSVSYKVICTPSQFSLLAQTQNASGNFILGKEEIDLAPYYQNNPQFKIGTATNPFRGKLIGFGFTLKNFKYVSESEDNVGMFGVLGANAEISNITIEDSLITGRSHVGLIGRAETSTQSITISDLVVDESNLINAKGNNWGQLIGTALASNSAIVDVSFVDVSAEQNIPETSVGQSLIGGIVGSGTSLNISDAAVSITFNSPSSSILSTKVGSVAGACLSCQITDITGFSYQTYKRGSDIGGIIGSLEGGKLEGVTQFTVFLNQEGSTSITRSSGGVAFAKNTTLLNVSLYLSAASVTDVFGGVIAAAEDAYYSSGTVAGYISYNGLTTAPTSYLGTVIGLSTNTSLNRLTSYVSLNSIGLINGDIVGGIVGQATGGSISGLAYLGTLYFPNASKMGGIIGVARNNNFLNLSNRGQLTGVMVGGLIGEGDNYAVTTSYSSGAISASSLGAGLTASTINSSLTNSFSTSVISGSNGSSKALIGSSSGSSISGLYYVMSQNPALTPCGGTDSCSGVATSVLSNSYFMSNLSNPPLNTWSSEIWGTNENEYPYLK